MTTVGLIGLPIFIAGLLVGRWWFAVGVGIAVFIAGAAFSPASSPSAEPPSGS